MSEDRAQARPPFLARSNRRDVLSEMADAPFQDVEASIRQLLESFGGGETGPKKDGKDGAADGIVGLTAGRFLDEDSGKESTDSTGKEATDSTGKESTDSTGKESTDSTGKESTDSTGKESTDSTGKESTDSTGKESTDSTGKESTDSTGKESTDSTGKESTDSTGKESTDGTGKESTDGTGKEATDTTGKEATDTTGKEATDTTGKEATDDTGKESTDTTGKEATDKPGKDSTIDDFIHWYTQTFNAKNTKDAFDEDPKGLRDTAIETPSDFDISGFTIGNTHEGAIVQVGPTAELDQQQFQLIYDTNSTLLNDLLRPDQPII